MTKQLAFRYDGATHILVREIDQETGVHTYDWVYPTGTWRFWTTPNSRHLPGGPIDWDLFKWRKTMGLPRLKSIVHASYLITNTPECMWL
jgi:hypothetical protein